MQRDHIVRLLNTGDEAAKSHRFLDATLCYYVVFQPELFDGPKLGFRRIAPLELYSRAAGRLKLAASVCAEKMVECRCFLAGESPDGAVGVPRGALNLYLISNQYDVFTYRALQYVEEELPERDTKRFLMSSVRARLSHLERVRECAELLDEELCAFDKLSDFENRLHTHLAGGHQSAHA